MDISILMGILFEENLVIITVNCEKKKDSYKKRYDEIQFAVNYLWRGLEYPITYIKANFEELDTKTKELVNLSREPPISITYFVLDGKVIFRQEDAAYVLKKYKRLKIIVYQINKINYGYR